MLWVFKFEKAMASMQKTSDLEIANNLALYLDGIALRYYMSLSNETQLSFKLAKNTLITRFSPSQIESSFKLDSCEMSPTEDFESFGFKVKQLVDESYPSFEVEKREILYYQNFVKKINPEIARIILCNDAIRTVDQAVSMCQKISNTQNIGR